MTSAFGRRLRTIRRARGLTQAEVAGSELSISYVSLLESGRRQPTPDTVATLATALGCDPAELTGGASALTEPAGLLVRQAELELEAGDPAAALARFEQVRAGAEAGSELHLRAVIGRARALHRAGRLGEAVAAYETAVRSGLLDPAAAASTEVVVGWCRCLYDLGELSRAAEVGTRALEELAALNARDSEASIQLLATVAAAWYELGELRQAENLLDEGLTRAAAVSSPAARGAILWNASTVAHERGRYQQALELADEALAAFRSTGDHRAVGRLLTVRGYVLLHGDPPRPREALDVLQQALDTLGGGTVVDVAYARTELSRAHLLLGDVDSAIAAAEAARDAVGEGTRLEHARATIALAAAVNVRGKRHDKARADALFDTAVGVLEEVGATRTAARGWNELGLVLAERGDLAGAVDAFTRGAAAVNLLEPHLARRSGRGVTAG